MKVLRHVIFLIFLFNSLTLQSQEIWQQRSFGDGDVILNLDGSYTIRGTNNEPIDNNYIKLPATTYKTVSFTWDYYTDDYPSWTPFYYSKDGVDIIRLSDDDDNLKTQHGTFSINLLSSDDFEIGIGGGGYGAGHVTISNLRVVYIPTLIISPIATLTSNCSGVPSIPKTFSVNGSNLSSTVNVSAPSGFEISTLSNTSYASSLRLTPVSNTVSQTLYIRLSSSATTNGASGTITATSSGATDATTTVISTIVDPPTFSVTGPYTICSEGTYAVSLKVANSYNGWTTSSNAISVNSSGYVTAGTVSGTYSVSYSDACAQTTSATVTVSSTSTLPAITDGIASYKFNNNPQGPIGSGNVIYMGYNGYNYSSTIRPTNTGFYKANYVSGSSAGSPTQFYIFRCTTCGTVSEYAKRPQGTLTGNTISQGGTGQLTYTSSNGGGPFTIVYQATGASPVTVNNISSTVAFNVGTPTITTSYKLISVTDENTKASTDFSGTIATVFSDYVRINNQIWTRKNLDVTTYLNGDPIPQVTDPAAWAGLTTGAWCYYNNDPANGAIYGKLYNWYAVNDPRGLAPQGWHFPTDAEWTILSDYLGGASLAGGKMKSTGTTYWTSPNTGATNSSGFAGLPGGYRYSNGTFCTFYAVSRDGYWWSATELNSTNARFRNLHYNGDDLSRDDEDKSIGFSVRLVKD